MSTSDVLSDSVTPASAPSPVQSSTAADLATAPAGVPVDAPLPPQPPSSLENPSLHTSNSEQQVSTQSQSPTTSPNTDASASASAVAIPSAVTAPGANTVSGAHTVSGTVIENEQSQNIPTQCSPVAPMKSEVSTVPLPIAKDEVVEAQVVKGEPSPVIKCEEQQQQPQPQPVVASSVEPLAPTSSSPLDTIPSTTSAPAPAPTPVPLTAPNSTVAPTVEASIPSDSIMPQVKNEPANIVKTEDEQTNVSVEVPSKTASVDPRDPPLAIKSEVVATQNDSVSTGNPESIVAPPLPQSSGPTSAVPATPSVADVQAASSTIQSPKKATPPHVPRQPMLSQPAVHHGAAVSAAVDPRSVAVAEQPPPPPPPAPPQITGPPPRNLPKTCKHRPKNARVFVGNLASEFTTPYEMVRIFYKYGELIEEPVLRRSFGFIQYANPDSAARAVIGEQGKIIGGIPIDLSIADNREVKKGTHIVNNTPFPHGPKGKGGRPVPAGATLPNRKRRRSQSPPRRMGGVHPPQFRRSRPEPRNGVHMRILCMSGTARNYARQCEAMFRAETNLGCDVVQIVAAGLGEALGKCMALQIPYVLVVASKDVEDGTCTIRTLERTGYEKSGRGNGVITLREAIDVCRIDRGIPIGRNNPPGAGPPPPASSYGNHQVQMVQAGWSHQNNGPAPPHPQGGQLPVRKPGWMSGPRAPPHPQQPAHVRGGAPPAPMHAHAQSAHYGQQQMSGRGYDMQDYTHSQSGGPGMGWNQQPGAYPAPQGNYAPQQPAMQQPGYGAPGHGYAPPQQVMGGRGGGRDEYDPAAVMGNAGRPQDASPYGAGWQGYGQPPGGRGQARGNGGYAGTQAPYSYPTQQYGAGRGATGAGNTYMGYDYGQQYGANSYAQQQPAPPPAPAPPAPESKNAPLVDVGKLTNLISAFQQQQQQHAQQPVSAPQAPQNASRDRQPMLTAPSMQQGARRSHQHQPQHQHQNPYQQHPYQYPPQGQQQYFRR